MTDIEIGIMVKNMAREMVSEMRASAKNAEVSKEQVKALLIKWGNNPADVEKMIEQCFDRVAPRYSTAKAIAEAIRILY